jgi:hypothetical protein
MTQPSLRQPIVLFPLFCSFAGLALVIGHASVYGVVHEADEGAAAHIFQILMVVQAPVLILFLLRWLPRAPWKTLRLLTVEAGAMLLAFSSVYFLT